MERLPPGASRPSRPELWRAALAIAAEHPWRGVGPDNFRQVYGTYVGSTRWDARVHANSMYLELLSGAGVPGLAALLGVLGAAGVVLWRRVQRSVHEPSGVHAAAAAGMAWWLVVAGHGFVDAFLSFTPIYVMLAVTAGLMLSRGVLAHEACNAHRV
jgi:O-antigen ligase